ncbi:MAG: hypothetical protein JXQ72_10180, partial [Anaerolineae bacterium]|nr:hypothetical protein [Anaerolineae bacterium]
MNDQQDRGALWQTLFTGRTFAPEDIGPLMDAPPNEVMIRLNKALFEPLQAMVGFADLWHVEVDLRAVQQVCGVPARDLRDAVGRSVTALHTQARRVTDEYWSAHLGSLNELVPGSDLGPDSGANEQAAPRDFE